MTTQGIAANVPFIAHPPHSGDSRGLVVVWHMLDPPRNELAMASALRLDGVAAWRVYPQLPTLTKYDDPVLDVFGPTVEQTVDRFPAVLKALHREFPVGDGPVRLVGSSISALAVLDLIAAGVDVSAAVLISPAIQLSRLIAANEAAFGMTYPWSEASRALAERYDFVARADELAKHNVPMLLVVGENDDVNVREPAERLWQALPGICSLVTVPGMAHALSEEPGVEPTPQTAHATKVDAIVSDWLSRH